MGHIFREIQYPFWQFKKIYLVICIKTKLCYLNSDNLFCVMKCQMGSGTYGLIFYHLVPSISTQNDNILYKSNLSNLDVDRSAGYK